jgi:hypothetical protein
MLVALLALAGVFAYLLLWYPDPLVLTGAEAAPAAQPGRACDVTVDVVGTIHTNGESTGPLTQTTEVGKLDVQVHLLWTLSGKGSYPATATLEISQPRPLSAVSRFTYSCR